MVRLDFGANPKARIVGEKYTAFHLSLYKANIAVIDGMLDLGVNMLCQSGEGVG